MATISKTITSILVFAHTMFSFADINTDVYDIKLKTNMPRVYDNMQSTGYRKYQYQTITGKMYVTYDEQNRISICFSKFTNNTYKISGKHVTYDVFILEDVLYNFSWCGNNRIKCYNRPNCNFSIDMVPSYKIGEEMLDDVHLSIAFTKGSKKKIKVCGHEATIPYSLWGLCTGQIGCNCTAWGHISPTRFWGYWGPSDDTTDIASVNGQVMMKFNVKESRK